MKHLADIKTGQATTTIIVTAIAVALLWLVVIAVYALF